MNGDSYRSRGGDRDRHGSSRDYRSSRDDVRERDRDRDPHRDRERRHRSRSPHHRSSRRDPEADSYSSSRGYREREREERYRDPRADRRDDRGAWDRDRGYRRGEGGRDGDRPPRRDRDLFDDRRGDRRGDRGDRPDRGERPPRMDRMDREAFQGGPRDSSPPKKVREPTPDLTDVVPILERRRRLTQWDIKPAGYENVTSEQAKLSGMFPLPGAPRQQPMDPSKLQAFMNQPAGTASGAALSPHNAKQSKRLFISNIPANVSNDTILEFFNLQLNGMNVVSGLDPCISVQINKDRSFALIELKSAEDATVVLAMDGISMHDNDNTGNGDMNGSASGFTIKRPKDYIVPTSADTDMHEAGVVNNVVLDSPHKMSVRNIPEYLDGAQVTELLTSFGDLRSFVLAQDTGTEQSKGFAFCEYADRSVTDIAVEGLNGMELGENHLIVQRASIGVAQAASLGGTMSVNAMSLLAGTTSADLGQGRVLQLLNMVTPEELMDSDEYAEICADVKEECEKYGSVLEMKVPRPVVGDRQNPGIGKIYVKYDVPESAQKALKALAGRKFADRTVVVTFFGEEYFDVNAW